MPRALFLSLSPPFFSVSVLHHSSYRLQPSYYRLHEASCILTFTLVSLVYMVYAVSPTMQKGSMPWCCSRDKQCGLSGSWFGFIQITSYDTPLLAGCLLTRQRHPQSRNPRIPQDNNVLNNLAILGTRLRI